MKFISNYIATFIIVLIFTSCESNTYSEIEGETIVTNPTYQKDIKPIIDSNCISCHDNGSGIGGFPLLTYDDVRLSTESGNLIFRIESATGELSMPRNATKLSPSKINLIKLWAANNYPN
ncbi:MAG: hypothetical protein O9267_06095 [Flavobacterium sp.]|uniref:c-type cytochrome n=1 Tax=Flavobacterium sp. TaxID=239 RepID=UPI0022CCA892|nr:hypothetical protein [Flavobacterium sp.]MCZ8197156.1 hypothetical protein [Flavobacterium sp.]